MAFTVNGTDYDEAILAGQPDNPDDYDPLRKQAWEHAVRTATAEGNTPIRYQDSITRPCAVCGVATRVGPRQQELLKTQPNALIVCLVDAPMVVDELSRSDNVTFGLTHLNNQEG